MTVRRRFLSVLVALALAVSLWVLVAQKNAEAACLSGTGGFAGGGFTTPDDFPSDPGRSMKVYSFMRIQVDFEPGSPGVRVRLYRLGTGEIMDDSVLTSAYPLRVYSPFPCDQYRFYLDTPKGVSGSASGVYYIDWD